MVEREDRAGLGLGLTPGDGRAWVGAQYTTLRYT
jgi:hypothetical protein